MTKSFLGEFEQMIMMALLRLEETPYAPAVSRLLERDAGRRVSRGALYTTLDRLEKKGYLEWRIEASTSARGGSRKRAFRVTDEGLEALRSSYRAMEAVARGLEGVLSEESPS